MNVTNQNSSLAKVAVHKSLLKEYTNNGERIVYLDNNTEFQIQIFNPYSYVIGVSFEFNDEINYNNQLLVLRPGERVWLDRYLNSESKLLFSTYEVNNSNVVKEAIKNNGKLTIKFFKEKSKQSTYYISSSPYIYYNNYDPYGSSICGDNINAINSINYCDCNLSNTSISSAVSTLGINTTFTSASTAAAYSSDDSASSNDSTLISCKSKSKSIETGRIEEGSHSNQKFQNVYKDFETWAFKTETIKILPKSQKPIFKNDLIKKYCHECGRKVNTKFKFCPYCGSEI